MHFPLSEVQAFALSSSWVLQSSQKLPSQLLTQLPGAFDYLLEGDVRSMRREVNLAGVSFLLSLHPQKKVICLSSARLNEELFLLEQFENWSEKHAANDQEEKLYEDLKRHVEMMLSIPLESMPSVIETVIGESSTAMTPAVEALFQRKLKDLLVIMRRVRPSLLERCSDFALQVVAEYSVIRLNLLKFVGLLPSLEHDRDGDEVKRLFLEALRRTLEDHKENPAESLPVVYVNLIRLTSWITHFLWPELVAFIVRKSVRTMSRRFIAGENVVEAIQCLKGLQKNQSIRGRDATLDQLGELVVSEKEADAYLDKVLKIIKGLSTHYPSGEKNSAGIYRAHVSIKVTALCSDFRPEAFLQTYRLVAPRLQKILMSAWEHKVFIQVDAEHYHVRDSVFSIFRQVVLENEQLKNYDGLGMVLQAYLRDALEHWREILQFASERPVPLGLRLVKGAYWDAETVEARVHAYDAPQFLNKEETDINYRFLIEKILAASAMEGKVQLAIASHNVADHSFGEALREEIYPQSHPIEHQCLHMTYEALSIGMAQYNLAVRNYVPVGDLLVGMAYLVRRILENSSQVGILAISRSHKNNVEYPAPEKVHQERKLKGQLNYDASITELKSDFCNVTPLRLYKKEQRQSFDSTLKALHEKLQRGEILRSVNFRGEEILSMSPAYPQLVVGSLKSASFEEVEEQLQVLHKSYQSGIWSLLAQEVRSSYLVRAAEELLLQRNYFAAVIVYESGKSVPEALADVDEAIDFLQFYAREGIKLAKRHPQFVSRGVVGVIAPWNFPLAIPVGMMAGALVMGNSVILKSAQHTPMIVELLVELFYAVGIPRQVLVHLVGRGRLVGEALIHHPLVTQIVFTGSKAVGMHLYNGLSKQTYTNSLFHYKAAKKVVVEMGGKNAVIVMKNAELDETVSKCLHSAFSHAGQKCSALSRIFVHESIKDKLVDRLSMAIKDLKVGVSDDYAVYMNPLVSLGERDRLREVALKAAEEAKVLGGTVHVDRSQEDLPGACMGPVFIELPFSTLEKSLYFESEMFGPILHITSFKDVGEVLDVLHRGEYALTGGVFAQSQDDIEELLAQFPVGNIYINRGITGARVGIEPFGGFKMSGTGPKAGGVDYLESFGVIPWQSKLRTEQHIHSSSNGIQESEKVILALPSREIFKSENDYLRKWNGSLRELFMHFEEKWGGMAIPHKKVLQEMMETLQSWGENPRSLCFKTRKIPGQVNYDDLSWALPQGVLVAKRAHPSLPMFHAFLAAYSAGCSVTVVALTQEAGDFWQGVLEGLARAFQGEEKKIFALNRCNEENLAQLVCLEEANFFFLDVAEEELTSLVASFDLRSLKGNMVKSFYTDHDLSQRSTDELIKKLTLVRSVAMNVMRFGASLE